MQLCMNELTIMQNGDLFSHIAACAEQGYSYMEIRKASLIRTLREGRSLDEIDRALKDHGVTPVCVNAIESISFHDRRGMRMLKELSDYLFYCCRRIGCGCVEVIASFRPPTDHSDEIKNETVQALLQLSDVAGHYGVNLALEYMGLPASSVKTFLQSLEIVNAVGRDNVGILLDTWHHYAFGSQPEDILRAQDGQILMVHVIDCPAREPGEAVRSESYFPGDGVVPVTDILRNLKKVGYDGAVSVEVFDPAVQSMPAEECLVAAREKTLAVMKAADVLTLP